MRSEKCTQGAGKESKQVFWFCTDELSKGTKCFAVVSGAYAPCRLTELKRNWTLTVMDTHIWCQAWDWFAYFEAVSLSLDTLAEPVIPEHVTSWGVHVTHQSWHQLLLSIHVENYFLLLAQLILSICVSVKEGKMYSINSCICNSR